MIAAMTADVGMVRIHETRIFPSMDHWTCLQPSDASATAVSVSSKLQFVDFIGFYCSRLATRGLAAPSTRPEPVVRVDFAMSGGRDISIHFGWSQAYCESTTGFLGVPDLDELVPCGPFQRPPGPWHQEPASPSPAGASARRPRIAQRAQLDTAAGNAPPIG